VTELHYTFPPAAAYSLNRCLFALKSDPAFLARYLADPAAAATEMGLDEDETRDLVGGDRDALLARGAHAYLVFMAALRVRMEREPTEFEYF
jgi:Aromatic-ring-opening dioxygenase LigAB, LigA subunit